MATSPATYRSRLEAAETALDEMMADGRGVVEYTEPGTGVRVRKDPQALRDYIAYLTQRIAATSTSSSGRVLAAFSRPW